MPMNGVGGRGCGVQKRTAEHEKRAIWARFSCSAVVKGGEAGQHENVSRWTRLRVSGGVGRQPTTKHVPKWARVLC